MVFSAGCQYEDMRRDPRKRARSDEEEDSDAESQEPTDPSVIRPEVSIIAGKDRCCDG